MDKDFEQRVYSVNLTKKETLVAQYIFDNLDIAAFSTATALAAAIGVSDVTIHRFAHNLGYSNFSEMQKALQKDISNRLQNQKAYFRSPGKQIDEQFGGNLDNVISMVAKQSITNIEKFLDKILIEDVEQASKYLTQGRRNFVIGFWSASVLADYFAIKFRYNSDNVITITKTSPESIMPVLSVTRDDCVVVFSHSRYPKMSIKLAASSKNRGAKIIAITDKETSPIVPYADICFFADTDGIAFSSYVASMLLIEIILTNTTKLMWKVRESHHRRQEDMLQELDFF